MKIKQATDIDNKIYAFALDDDESKGRLVKSLSDDMDDSDDESIAELKRGKLELQPG